MIFVDENISMRELECAIKDIKKATDKRGLISEYPKALKHGSRED